MNSSAFLVALSGIDASGKGFISRLLCEELGKRKLNVACIPLDPWHHPPSARFDSEKPAEHFYQNAFRWHELFNHLIFPLKQNKSIQLSARLTAVDEDRALPHRFSFQNIDLILLEGIFLFKKEIRLHYDLSIWIECPFESAMKRAIARNQENLSPALLIRDYQTIYFPAQRIHFRRDAPQQFAEIMFDNNHDKLC